MLSYQPSRLPKYQTLCSLFSTPTDLLLGPAVPSATEPRHGAQHLLSPGLTGDTLLIACPSTISHFSLASRAQIFFFKVWNNSMFQEGGPQHVNHDGSKSLMENDPIFLY